MKGARRSWQYITPVKKPPKKLGVVVAFDIETEQVDVNKQVSSYKIKQQSKLLFGTACAYVYEKLGEKKKVEPISSRLGFEERIEDYYLFDELYFEDRERFTRWVLRIAKKFQKVYVFAHNTSFDIRESVDFTLLRKDGYEIRVFNPQSKQFIITFEKVKEKQKRKWQIVFADTLNLYPSSLEKVGKLLGMEKLEKKLGLDRANLKKAIEEGKWELVLKYNIRDTQITATAVIVREKVINSLGGQLRLTNPSTAMDLFRRRFLKVDIKRPGQRLKDFVRRSYFGGRTEVFFRGIVTTPQYRHVAEKLYERKKNRYKDYGFFEVDSIHYLDVNCMPGDTLVIVKGKGQVPISEVREGDYVLGINGWHRVKKKWEYDYEGLLYNINGLKTTPWHKFYVSVKGKRQWHNMDMEAEKISKTSQEVYVTRLNWFFDKVFKPISEEQVLISELVGIIWAEGNVVRRDQRYFDKSRGKYRISHQYRIDITINSEESDFLERIKYILEKLYSYRPYIKHKNGENAVTVVIARREIFEDIMHHMENWKDLHLPSLLRGLMEGDGTVNTKRKSLNLFLSADSNPELIEKVRYILDTLGIKYHEDERSIKVRLPQGKDHVVNRHLFEIFEYDSLVLYDALVGFISQNKYSKLKWIIEGKNFKPHGQIMKREKVQVSREWFKGKVYDLTLEGKPYFFANGILTHNSLYPFSMKYFPSPLRDIGQYGPEGVKILRTLYKLGILIEFNPLNPLESIYQAWKKQLTWLKRERPDFDWESVERELESRRGTDSLLDLKDIFTKPVLYITEATVHVKKKHITETVTPLPVKMNDKLVFPQGTFSGVWTQMELSLLNPPKDVEIRKIHRIVLFEADWIFIEYINTFYAMKNEAKQKGDSISYMVSKLMMNSLYGKWAEKKKISVVMSKEEFADFIIKEVSKNKFDFSLEIAFDQDYGTLRVHGKTVNALGGYYEVKVDEYYEPYSVSVATFVTSTARSILRAYMYRVKENGGLVFYTDTDSLICDGLAFEALRPYIDKYKLGYLDEEIPGIAFVEINTLKDYKVFVPVEISGEIVEEEPIGYIKKVKVVNEKGEKEFYLYDDEGETFWVKYKLKGVPLSKARAVSEDDDVMFKVERLAGLREFLKYKTFGLYWIEQEKELKRVYDKAANANGWVEPYYL